MLMSLSAELSMRRAAYYICRLLAIAVANATSRIVIAGSILYS